MSDDRWFEVAADAASAARHFGAAVRLYRAGGFDAPDLDGYRAAMAFQHAMQSGHTSLEAALLRVLDLLGEARPSGRDWHADLIRRASATLPTRGPLLDAEEASAADRTRRFRHVAMRAYDGFEPEEAVRAVEAAERLAARLPAWVPRLRAVLDP